MTGECAGFNWASLPKGSIVVDVGGGVGNLTMALAKVHKHLRFIVQDRPGTVREGETVGISGLLYGGDRDINPLFLFSFGRRPCRRTSRAALSAYKVRQLLSSSPASSSLTSTPGHDFFEEQPVKDAAIFVTRHVTHNWPDKHVRKYLTRLREAARPDTKLVVIDEIQDYLCRNIGDVADIPGAAKVPAPEPLLPYPETATSFGYGMDLCVSKVPFVWKTRLADLCLC